MSLLLRQSTLLVLLAVLALPAAALAAPMTIAYSGRMLDDESQPLEGDWVVGVALFDPDAADPDLPVWSDEFPTVLTDGYFAVVLGSNPEAPLDADLFDSASVQVAVSLEGGPYMTPFAELTSAPYAIRAEAAETAKSADHAANVSGGTVSGTGFYLERSDTTPPTTTTLVDGQGNWVSGIDTDKAVDMPSLKINGVAVINSERQWVADAALDLPANSTLDGEEIVTGEAYSDVDVEAVIGGFSLTNPKNHPRYTPDDLLVDIGVISSPVLSDTTLRGQLHWTPAEIVAATDPYYLRIDNRVLDGLELTDTLNLVGDTDASKAAEVRFFDGDSSDPEAADYLLSSFNGTLSLTRPDTNGDQILEVATDPTPRVTFSLQDEAMVLSVDNTWGSVVSFYGNDGASPPVVGVIAEIKSEAITFSPELTPTAVIAKDAVTLVPLRDNMGVATGGAAVTATDEAVSFYGGDGRSVPLRVVEAANQVQFFGDDGNTGSAAATISRTNNVWNGTGSVEGVSIAGGVQVSGPTEVLGVLSADGVQVWNAPLQVKDVVGNNTALVEADGDAFFKSVDVDGTLAVDGSATVTGNVTVTGSITASSGITTGCPSFTIDMGPWCIDRSVNSPATFRGALQGCEARNMHLCPVSAMVACDYVEAGSANSSGCDAAGSVWTSDATAGDPVNILVWSGTSDEMVEFPLTESGANTSIPLPYFCCMPRVVSAIAP